MRIDLDGLVMMILDGDLAIRCAQPLTPALSPSDGEREKNMGSLTQGRFEDEPTLGWLPKPLWGFKIRSGDAFDNRKRATVVSHKTRVISLNFGLYRIISGIRRKKFLAGRRLNYSWRELQWLPWVAVLAARASRGLMFKKILSQVVFIQLLAGVAFGQTNQPAALTAETLPPLASCKQLLLVTTADWQAVPGTLHRFVRTNTESPWVEVGESLPVVVGRNGLGWGKGLNPAASLPGPVKKEGDGKSPAGIFRLSSAFGLVEADKIKPLKLPYQYLSEGIECVDDVKSAHYNSIVDRAQTSPVDWDSSEKMRAVGQYRLGVVIDHNADPREPGGGSCVFLHIWKDEHTGTSGCTAMASDNIDAVVPWLDPADEPLLVQLPHAEYERLQKEWRLP